jgi:hypothetical protein
VVLPDKVSLRPEENGEFDSRAFAFFWPGLTLQLTPSSKSNDRLVMVEEWYDAVASSSLCKCPRLTLLGQMSYVLFDLL